MDIIFGTVVATSVFLISMALTVLFVRIPVPGGRPGAESEARGLAQRAMATSLIVYFVAILDLLLIAQQTSLALGTFVVGFVTLVVLYVEPAFRTRGSRVGEESESWER